MHINDKETAMKNLPFAFAAAFAAVAAQAEPASLCSVVTPAQVQAIVKQPVSGSQPLKYTRGCRYETASRDGSVTLNFLNTAGDGKAEFDGQKRLMAALKPQSISGVGDEAVFGMVLIVRKGQRVLMVEPQALPEGRRREQAIALARLVLEKIQ
jgi:hypothetical protein